MFTEFIWNSYVYINKHNFILHNLYVPAGWLETPSYVTLTSRVLAFAYAIPVMNTWNTKTMDALTVVCTPTLKSVLGLGNTKNCILLLLCVCNGARGFSPAKFVNLLFIDWKLGFPIFLKWAFLMGVPNIVVTLLSG